MGCYFVLHGFFLTQGSNRSLLYFLHWQADYLPLSHLGSPEGRGSSRQYLREHWGSSSKESCLEVVTAGQSHSLTGATGWSVPEAIPLPRDGACRAH